LSMARRGGSGEGKKDDTMETIMVVVGLAVAADFILVGSMPPLFTALMSGDTSILSRPGDWFGFLKTIGQGGPAAPAPPVPTTAPAGAPAPPPTGGTAGGCPSPANCNIQYLAKDSGLHITTYESGGSDPTIRYNVEGVKSKAYEAIIFINVGPCADELAIKCGGPGHDDGACCWIGIDVDCKTGHFTIGGEGPHPKTNKAVKSGESMGSIQNKEVGIKCVVKETPTGAHVEGYADVGGQWKLMVSYDGIIGNEKTSTKFVETQQVQFRVDCAGVKITRAGINPLDGGAGVDPNAPAQNTGASAANEAEKPLAMGEFANKPVTKAKFTRSRYATYFSPPKPEPTTYYNGRRVYYY
jgi:hypothetical protein